MSSGSQQHHVNSVCLQVQLQGNACPVLPPINTGKAVPALSACFAQPGLQDRHIHVSCEYEAVTSHHECPWPFSFARAWLKHAMLRTNQLVLDVHFCLSSWLCTDQWSPNKVSRFILEWVRNLCYCHKAVQLLPAQPSAV